MRFAVEGWVANRLSMRTSRQRVDDKERGRRRVPLGGNVLDLAGCSVDLSECRDEPKRIPGQLSATAVGGVLAGSADRHLHQHRSQRRQKNGQ